MSDNATKPSRRKQLAEIKKAVLDFRKSSTAFINDQIIHRLELIRAGDDVAMNEGRLSALYKVLDKINGQ
jgi:hypothetical protein